ncbi:MAG: hypothetical protein EA348_02245 [Pseudomonadaceae bacterium]|nr:MAG: hypothetical protein EA348_02245 [Pseudomonadaceae bacterium]
MMKKLAIAIATASTLGAASMAQAETFDTAIGELDVSMTATLATDYIWRGQSQTAGKGAVQSSLDIAHESGFYIGAWGSNVDFGDGDDSTIELDYYLGFGADITPDVSYDISWNSYTFPGESGNNAEEWILGVGVFGLDLGFHYTYDPESSRYYTAGYGFDLPEGFALGLHIGYGDNSDDTYRDWAATVSKEFLGLDLALMYSDTNISSSDCREAYGRSGSCSSNWTFSASKSF